MTLCFLLVYVLFISIVFLTYPITLCYFGALASFLYSRPRSLASPLNTLVIIAHTTFLSFQMHHLRVEKASLGP